MERDRWHAGRAVRREGGLSRATQHSESSGVLAWGGVERNQYGPGSDLLFSCIEIQCQKTETDCHWDVDCRSHKDRRRIRREPWGRCADASFQHGIRLLQARSRLAPTGVPRHECHPGGSRSRGSPRPTLPRYECLCRKHPPALRFMHPHRDRREVPCRRWLRANGKWPESDDMAHLLQACRTQGLADDRNRGVQVGLLRGKRADLQKTVDVEPDDPCMRNLRVSADRAKRPLGEVRSSPEKFQKSSSK